MPEIPVSGTKMPSWHSPRMMRAVVILRNVLWFVISQHDLYPTGIFLWGHHVITQYVKLPRKTRVYVTLPHELTKTQTNKNKPNPKLSCMYYNISATIWWVVCRYSTCVGSRRYPAVLMNLGDWCVRCHCSSLTHFRHISIEWIKETGHMCAHC